MAKQKVETQPSIAQHPQRPGCVRGDVSLFTTPITPDDDPKEVNGRYEREEERGGVNHRLFFSERQKTHSAGQAAQSRCTQNGKLDLIGKKVEQILQNSPQQTSMRATGKKCTVNTVKDTSEQSGLVGKAQANLLSKRAAPNSQTNLPATVTNSTTGKQSHESYRHLQEFPNLAPQNTSMSNISFERDNRFWMSDQDKVLTTQRPPASAGETESFHTRDMKGYMVPFKLPSISAFLPPKKSSLSDYTKALEVPERDFLAPPVPAMSSNPFPYRYKASAEMADVLISMQAGPRYRNEGLKSKLFDDQASLSRPPPHASGFFPASSSEKQESAILPPKPKISKRRKMGAPPPDVFGGPLHELTEICPSCSRAHNGRFGNGKFCSLSCSKTAGAKARWGNGTTLRKVAAQARADALREHAAAKAVGQHSLEKGSISQKTVGFCNTKNIQQAAADTSEQSLLEKSTERSSFLLSEKKYGGAPSAMPVVQRTRKESRTDSGQASMRWVEMTGMNIPRSHALRAPDLSQELNHICSGLCGEVVGYFCPDRRVWLVVIVREYNAQNDTHCVEDYGGNERKWIVNFRVLDVRFPDSSDSSGLPLAWSTEKV